MQIIREEPKLYAAVLGEQPVNMGQPYRRADFCCTAAAPDGKTVVSNTFTREIFLPSDAELALLQQDTVLADETSAELIRKWYFVPPEYDEITAIDDLRMFLRMVAEKKAGQKSALLMMTGNCNARCFYCYQKGRFTCKDTMTNETAEAVADYLADFAGESELRLNWHGGEPTLCAEQIDIICNRLRARGVRFWSAAYTNGYLLDESLAAHAKQQWELRGVQITMDGPEDVYNRCKAYVYKNDPSPYRHILSNIRGMLDMGIRVSVRVNVDRHNAQQLKVLAKDLADAFGKDSQFALYCAALFEDCRDLTKAYSEQMREEITEQMILFQQYCQELGLTVQHKFGRSITLHCCVATDPLRVEILPSGELSCCDHAIANDIYGSVFSADRDLALRASWLQSRNCKEMCTGCTAYADCIMLKNCTAHAHGCNPSFRRLRNYQLQAGILEEYRNWRTKSGLEKEEME